MRKYHKSSRRRTLIRGYRLFLMGSNEIEITKAGINEIELTKIKQFHNLVSEGVHYVSASNKCYIDLTIGKRLFQMFQEKLQGRVLTFYDGRPRVKAVFKMLMQNMTDREIIANGYSELEVEKAKAILPYCYLADKMLISTIAQKTRLKKSTVADLLKIFRDKQDELKLVKTI